MALTLTQNLSLTFANSADERIDFMFNVIEGSPLDRTTDLLEKSWKQSPIDTLKLLFYTRDIRRGKGCRAQFLLCLKWIYDNHFEILLKILQFFPEYGCYKDYFNLLLIALFDDIPYDAEESQEAKETAKLVSKYDRIILKRLDKETKRSFNEIVSNIYSVKRKQIKTANGKRFAVRTSINKKDIVKAADKGPLTVNEIKEFIKEKSGDSFGSKKDFFKFKTDKRKLRVLIGYRRDYLEDKLKNDEKFAKLYKTIVEIVVVQLQKDYDSFQKPEQNISLLSKWIPNRGKQFDKFLFIQTPIAKEFLSRVNISKVDDKQTVFEFEKIITKFRRSIKIPEISMSEKRWNEIVYGRVTSKALIRYKTCFIREDGERYKDYIDNSKTVKGGALTPAELIAEIIRVTGSSIQNFIYSEKIEVSEEIQLELMTLDKQWLSLVEDIKKKNTLLLNETLAICDVSGSMCFTTNNIQPIYGALGLTLLLMHFTTGVWAKKCIAFSETPKMFEIDIDKPVFDQVHQLLKIDAGLSTDLNLTFQLILDQATEARLPQERMPKVIFIFSDMEFNCACPGFTNFETARMQFDAAGYQLPLIVFWNLNGNKIERSTPVKCDENGVVLLSGYSAQTLNFFTCEDFEQISPKTMLNKILEDERYAAISTE